MPRKGASDIAIRLGRRAEAVCRYYLAAGRRDGRYWRVGDVQGNPGGSMYVRLTGPERGKGAVGRWTDAATGEHGDLLDVIRETLGLVDFGDVAKEARRFLAEPIPAPEEPATGRISSIAVGSPEASRRLFAMSKPIGGTLGQVYLNTRAIRLLSGVTALRYHARCYYRPDEHSPTETWPAIVAAVTDLAGHQTGAHRTWLAPDGSGKAPVETPRRAMSFLGLYRDPVVAAVTSRCDWRIADLIADPEPSTLYLVVPPSDISRTKPLIRLVLNQIGRRLTEDLHAKDRRHRVLLLLDEFPALGRLDFFESSLAFLAGYGIKSFLIAQSLNQIEKAYGQNNAILDNCHVRVSFATNDERTAKRVSDALGTATEMKAMQNYAGSRLAPWLGHIMVSRSETARQLLTPGEIMQLPPDDEIVMVAGSPPIRAKKARYYIDPRLTERILPPPDPATVAASARPDGWSALKPLAPDAALVAAAEEAARKKAEDKANAGLRREPDMPQHVEIVHEKKEPAPEDEFKHLLVDDQQDSARQRQVTGRQMRGLARQVSMDPNDGIDM